MRLRRGAVADIEIRRGEELVILRGPEPQPRPRLRLLDRLGIMPHAPELARLANRKPRRGDQQRDQNDRQHDERASQASHHD